MLGKLLDDNVHVSGGSPVVGGRGLRTLPDLFSCRSRCLVRWCCEMFDVLGWVGASRRGDGPDENFGVLRF